jgi:hypothetical protein
MGILVVLQVIASEGVYPWRTGTVGSNRKLISNEKDIII